MEQSTDQPSTDDTIASEPPRTLSRRRILLAAGAVAAGTVMMAPPPALAAGDPRPRRRPAYPLDDTGAVTTPTGRFVDYREWNHSRQFAHGSLDGLRPARGGGLELSWVVAPNGDSQVDYAARYAYDYTYEGAGNWPFNAAYAATFGLSAHVTRLTSLNATLPYLAAGIPLVASVRFTRAELPEAGYATNGHLLVIVGFTAAGDVIVNDPASADDAAVRRVYPRAKFANVWLPSTKSGGVAYVIAPASGRGC